MPYKVLSQVTQKLGLKRWNRKARKVLNFLDKAQDYSEEYSHYFKNVWGLETRKMLEI
jgi:hypothetical protein